MANRTCHECGFLEDTLCGSCGMTSIHTTKTLTTEHRCRTAHPFAHITDTEKKGRARWRPRCEIVNGRDPCIFVTDHTGKCRFLDFDYPSTGPGRREYETRW